MKLISIIFSVLLHLLFIAVLFQILSSHKIIQSKPKIYTVELLKMESKPKSRPKPQPQPRKQKTVLKKTIKVNFNKPQPKKKKIIKLPEKPRKSRKEIKKVRVKKKVTKKLVKKINKKPNIEEKIRLMKEKIMVEQLREKLLKEKIKMLKEKVYSQEEAQKIFKQKLASSYLSVIEGVIYKNWGVEKTIIENKVFITKVDIKLDSKGNLINISIMKSSGNAYFDGTCIDAIKQSAPFLPPPKEILTGGVVEFIITFDSREQE